MSVIRVEWAKTYARAARFKEEVLLVQEEMRRVLEHHIWKGGWWRSQGEGRDEVEGVLKTGERCYAKKQAELWEKLAAKCVKLWKPFLAQHDLAVDSWPEIWR